MFGYSLKFHTNFKRGPTFNIYAARFVSGVVRLKYEVYTVCSKRQYRAKDRLIITRFDRTHTHTHNPTASKRQIKVKVSGAPGRHTRKEYCAYTHLFAIVH